MAPKRTPGAGKSVAERRTPLTRERILEAALRFVDAQGLQALSMRKLAADLGVEAMSLYNHIENKEDILRGITDLLFAGVEVPDDDGGDWVQRTRRLAHAVRQALSDHPNVVPLVISRPVRTPAFLRMMDSAVGNFRAAGFDDDMAHHAWHTVSAHVVGYVLQEIATPLLDAQLGGAAAAPAAPADGSEPPLAVLPVEFPHVARIAPYLARCRPVDEFDFALDLILTGLQAKRSESVRARGAGPGGAG